MNDLTRTDFEFDSNPFWRAPLSSDLIDYDFLESNRCVYLFDVNGYDLSPIEIAYYKAHQLAHVDEADIHQFPLIVHRNEMHYSLQRPWYQQRPDKLAGYTLNHSMLLQRKGFEGQALEQLKKFAKRNPQLYKAINIRPKWGFDFALDYANHSSLVNDGQRIGDNPNTDAVGEGVAFEVFHYEYDGFDLEEIKATKTQLERVIDKTDFNKVSKELLKRKTEWFNLDFFTQSSWKCQYFGVPDEKFKVVTWNREVSSDTTK
jgi:hypothetical protein